VHECVHVECAALCATGKKRSPVVCLSSYAECLIAPSIQIIPKCALGHSRLVHVRDAHSALALRHSQLIVYIV
jgi:hypothetical protein